MKNVKRLVRGMDAESAGKQTRSRGADVSGAAEDERARRGLKIAYVAFVVVMVILLAYVFCEVVRCGKWGYFLILGLSLFFIYLGDNEAFQKQALLRIKISQHLEHVCESNHVDYRFIKDMRKFGIGPRDNFAAYVAFVPHKTILYFAYAFVVLYEQLVNVHLIPELHAGTVDQIGSIKFVAVAFFAIDRAVTAIRKDFRNFKTLENEGPIGESSSALRKLFGDTVLYRVEKLFSPYIHGWLMIVSIDKSSLLYQRGVREYDVIVSVNDQEVITNGKESFDRVRDAIGQWQDGKNLKLKVTTGFSDHFEEKTIEIPYVQEP